MILKKADIFKKISIFILLVSLMLIFGCGNQNNENQISAEPEQKAEAESIKILFIIAQKDFRDEELQEPKNILEQAGYKIEVASITKGTAEGVLGMKVEPDLAVMDAVASDYEYIIVVGGPGSLELTTNTGVLKVVREAKNVAAICLGPVTLAKAGVLSGKKATVFKTSDSLKALEQGKAIFVDQGVVVDGTTITANGPSAAKEFGEKIKELLGD